MGGGTGRPSQEQEHKFLPFALSAPDQKKILVLGGVEEVLGQPGAEGRFPSKASWTLVPWLLS